MIKSSKMIRGPAIIHNAHVNVLTLNPMMMNYYVSRAVVNRIEDFSVAYTETGLLCEPG